MVPEAFASLLMEAINKALNCCLGVVADSAQLNCASLPRCQKQDIEYAFPVRLAVVMPYSHP